MPDVADYVRAMPVAPFAGAWIEMRMVQSGVERVERRSLRGSVD